MSRVRTLAVAAALSLGAALLPTAAPLVAAGQEPPPDVPIGPDTPPSEALDPGDPSAPVTVDDATEVESERTASSRTYLDEDGTYTTMLSPEPVNYETADGTFEEIDPGLVRVEGRGASGWHNAANDFDVRIPGTLDGTFSAAVDGVNLSYRLADVPAGVAGEADGNQVSFALDEQRTVRYTSLATGIKEEVVLAGPTAPRRLDVDVDLRGGTLRLVEGGGAEVVGPDGTVAISIPAPWAVDADGAEGPVRFELADTEDGPRLSIVGDDAWLDAPDRAWPVVLDPDLIIQGSAAGADCYISSANPTGQNCTATTLRVGNEGGARRNAFLDFPDLEYAMPANTEQLDSYLYLNARSHTNATGNVTVRVNAATKAWTTLLNWTKANGSTVSWTNAGGDFDTTTDKYVNVAGTSKFLNGTTTGGFYLSVHEMVNHWLIKPSDNHGFVLNVPSTSTDTVDLTSSEWATPAEQPALFIRWKFREGLRSSSSYETFDVTDRSSVSVNRANLNAVVAATELDIQGTGQNLTISRFYNSRNDASRGWSWSVGADTQLFEGVNNTIIYQEASGADWLFQPKAAGGYWTPPGLNAKLTKTTADDYTLTFDRSNGKMRFQREGTLLVPTEMRDRNDNVITYDYTVVSGFPQITTVTDTQGRDVDITWTSGRITAIEDWTGRTASYTWTGGLLTTARDAGNNDTTYGYDGDDRLSTITTEEGRLTTLTYQATDDGIHEVIQRRDATVSYTTTFDLFLTPNKMTEVTDPNGHTVQHYWSFRDIVTRIHDALGNEPPANEYNDNNDATLITSNVSGVFDYGYSTDGNNNLETIQAPSSGANALETRFRYNTPGTSAGSAHLASSEVDPQGKCKAFHYDVAGNLDRTYDGATVSGGGGCDGATTGAETETHRNTDGTLDYVDDPLGNRTDYSYDADGNLTSINPPGTWGTTTRVPDALSRTGSGTDGAGQVTAFTYDNLDRITRITYSGDTTCASTSTCTTFTYDGDGNLVARVDNTGTTTFTYDGLGRLRSKALPGGSNACSSGGSAMTLDYDGAGNLISHCDAQGTITYRYDDGDRMIGMAEPGGSCVPGSEVDCTKFQYDADGKRTRVTYPTTPTAVSVAYTYPSNGGAYIKELDVMRGTTSLIDLSYTYSSGGNDTELVRTRVDNLNANVWSYGYDTRNRVCWANQSTVATSGTCTSPPAGANKYVLDLNGNRTSQVTTSGTTTYKYDGVNEMCWLYSGTSSNACGSAPSGSETQTHDGNGDLTGRGDGFASTYNGKRQPTSVTYPGGSAQTAVYSDVDSTERVQLGTTYFDNGPLGVMRSTTSSNTVTWTRDNEGRLLSQHRSVDSGARYYYVLDRLDSVIGMIDESGNLDNTYRYNPHGRAFSVSETVPNPWRFAGGYQDNDRSVKFGTRFYDTTTGRFTQPDPLAGSVWDPMVANRYAYAANDPLNMTDPTGYCVLGLFGDCDNEANDCLVGAGKGFLVGFAFALATVGPDPTDIVTWPAWTAAGCVQGLLD